MKLSEFIEKYPGYKPYVEFLKNFFEKPVDEIYVYSFGEAAELGYVAGENVMGFADPPDKVFFREMPPPLHTFIHELIHLCRKPPIVGEEVYAYNLVNLVIFCVEKGIKCNPFALFTLTVNDIERVLRKYGVQSIEEYYLVFGIMPFDYVIDFDEEGKIVRIKPSGDLIRDSHYERRVVEVFVTELIAGIPYYTDESLEAKILLDLIRVAGGSG
ncbi:MAG: hypothetical protein QW290_09445 [Sulfolobales archaeon]